MIKDKMDKLSKDLMIIEIEKNDINSNLFYFYPVKFNLSEFINK